MSSAEIGAERSWATAAATVPMVLWRSTRRGAPRAAAVLPLQLERLRRCGRRCEAPGAAPRRCREIAALEAEATGRRVAKPITRGAARSREKLATRPTCRPRLKAWTSVARQMTAVRRAAMDRGMPSLAGGRPASKPRACLRRTPCAMQVSASAPQASSWARISAEARVDP